MDLTHTGWIAAGLSDVGDGRHSNEDALLADVQRGLFAVADGIGGHNAGAVAARATVDALPLLLDRRLRSGERQQTTVTSSASPPRDPRSSHGRNMKVVLRDVVLALSAAVRAQGERDRSLRGMGSTLACLLVKGRSAYIANMGDSRVYLWRDELTCLTQDHSLTALLVREREISPRSAAQHPSRGQLTRFIGMPQNIYPDVCQVPVRVGMRFLLCTDGLWNVLSEKQISSVLGGEGDLPSMCSALVEAAKSRGSKDNITCVVAARQRKRRSRRT